MAEQPELDLPPVPQSGSEAVPRKPRLLFAGFTLWQILAALLCVAALIWAMWVTKAVTARHDRIVSARLSDLVGEYVEAQRYSSSPPEKVNAEMRAFMSSLDNELQRRSANGQIVIVGEAVLSKNVDDITDTLRKAIYASGVPVPKRAPPEAASPSPQIGAPQVPLSPPNVSAGQSGAAPSTVPAPPVPVSPDAVNPGVAGASVSTFGGQDGASGR